MRVPCLHLFRHIAQKFLDIRQYACEISIQSDEKSDGAIHTQSLCGIAFILTLALSLIKDADNFSAVKLNFNIGAFARNGNSLLRAAQNCS